MKTKVNEICPKCQRIHERGEFGEYQEMSRDSRNKSEMCTYFCAPDIHCPCGIDLEWAVPFFRVTDSGYILSPKPDYRKFRDPQIKAAK